MTVVGFPRLNLRLPIVRSMLLGGHPVAVIVDVVRDVANGGDFTDVLLARSKRMTKVEKAAFAARAEAFRSLSASVSSSKWSEKDWRFWMPRLVSYDEKN